MPPHDLDVWLFQSVQPVSQSLTFGTSTELNPTLSNYKSYYYISYAYKICFAITCNGNDVVQCKYWWRCNRLAKTNILVKIIFLPLMAQFIECCLVSCVLQHNHIFELLYIFIFKYIYIHQTLLRSLKITSKLLRSSTQIKHLKRTTVYIYNFLAVLCDFRKFKSKKIYRVKILMSISLS